MTTCDELTADAAGLMTLPPEAPERARAEEHARTCAACARALEEGRRLLLALDAAAPPLPPAAPLRAAAEPILRDILRDLAATPARRASPAIAAAATALASWALPLALARRPIEGGRTLGASIALGLVAALAAATTVTTGGLAAGAFPVISAIVSLIAGEGGAFRPHIGIHCALTELALATGAALAVALATWRRWAGDAVVLVAAAGGGALAGQAALHETCPSATELPHLLLFHTGPVMLAVALAVAAAHTLRALRPPPARAS
jgi:hypothetical protein